MTLFFIILAIVSIAILAYLRLFSANKETKELAKPTEDSSMKTEQPHESYVAKEEKPSVDLDEFVEDENNPQMPPPSITAPPPDFPRV